MATTAIAGMMNAVCIHNYGGPDAMRFEHMQRPEPGPGQVLVRVQAAGVNPVDWKIREGWLGQAALPQILGQDLSGTVEALGPGVNEYHVGDAVFGTSTDNTGAFAEFALADVAQIARRPEGLDDIQAAALPTAALTAWQALFDQAQLHTGQKLLVHAASGGVGSFAVQFGKWKDAYVIGTASIQNEHYVRELGIDEFIDYHQIRFEDILKDIDVVFDTIGNDTQQRSWGVLREGGVLVSIVQPTSEEAAAAHKVRGIFFRCDLHRGDQLSRIANLVLNGQVKVHVTSVLPLHEARKALDLSQHGHTRGKIVLKVE